MKDSITKNFDVGGRYQTEKSFEGGSRTWQKRKKGGGHPILVKSGRMKNEILYNDMQDKLQIKSSMPYSAAQQFGFPDNNLPSRPFLTFQDENRDSIGVVFRRHLSTNLPTS